MNIITDALRAYHTPCEIQSVVIAASFTSRVRMVTAVVTSVVVVVVVIAAAVVVAEAVVVEVVLITLVVSLLSRV